MFGRREVRILTNSATIGDDRRPQLVARREHSVAHRGHAGDQLAGGNRLRRRSVSHGYPHSPRGHRGARLAARGAALYSSRRMAERIRKLGLVHPADGRTVSGRPARGLERRDLGPCCGGGAVGDADRRRRDPVRRTGIGGAGPARRYGLADAQASDAAASAGGDRLGCGLGVDRRSDGNDSHRSISDRRDARCEPTQKRFIRSSHWGPNRARRQPLWPASP